jgi:C4-dicarboxylate transporter
MTVKMTIERYNDVFFERAIVEIEDTRDLSIIICALDEYIAQMKSLERSDMVEEIYQRALSIRKALE